ncbi:hypothetical protein FB451DRAFT_1170303 [Mycena latifolia]|nr:hypothetical protein FB451DRAFT_1170303 [Mycena latifolia]
MSDRDLGPWTIPSSSSSSSSTPAGPVAASIWGYSPAKTLATSVRPTLKIEPANFFMVHQSLTDEPLQYKLKCLDIPIPTDTIEIDNGILRLKRQRVPHTDYSPVEYRRSSWIWEPPLNLTLRYSPQATDLGTVSQVHHVNMEGQGESRRLIRDCLQGVKDSRHGGIIKYWKYTVCCGPVAGRCSTTVPLMRGPDLRRNAHGGQRHRRQPYYVHFPPYAPSTVARHSTLARSQLPTQGWRKVFGAVVSDIGGTSSKSLRL